MIVRDAAGKLSRGRPGRRAIARGTGDEWFGAEELGAIRIAVFAMWLMEVAPDPLSFWAELPRSMNRPIGVFKLVPEEAWDRVLEPEVLDDLQRLLVVVLALSAAGACPYRPLACAAAALLTAHQGLLRGFTFVNHEELALLICTYVLALFPAADAISCPPRRERLARPEVYAGAIDAMSLALVVPYAGIAARRLVRAGPGIFAGESIPHWLGSLDALDPEAVGIGPWLLARPRLVGLLKGAFAATTAFELLSPLCLIAPGLRRAWVPVIVAMHVGNRFILKLFFWQNNAHRAPVHPCAALARAPGKEGAAPALALAAGVTGPGSKGRSQAFGPAAVSYDRYRPAPAPEILDWLLRADDRDVLDVGAGTGQLTRLLCARCVSVTAVEPDPGMRAELAVGVPSARVLAGTAERLPVAAGSQDAVLSHAAWHWFRPWRASLDAARVLRPGGRLGALRTEIDPSVDWLAELWARLEPDPAARRPGGRARGPLRGWGSVERGRDALLFGAPGARFARRERHAVSFARRFSAQELVGLMGTYSGLLVRPIEEQGILLGRVSDFVSAHVTEAGSLEVPMVTHGWRSELRGQRLRR